MDKVKNWTRKLNKLAEFVSEHDRLPKSRSTGIEKRLHSWLVSQRGRARGGYLTENEKTQMSLACPGWNNVEYYRNKTWNNNLEQFKKFITLNSRLPKISKENQELFLFTWMQHQKVKFKKSQLTQEQIIALSQLFSLEVTPLEDFYMTLDASWEYQFEIFKEYYAETNKQPVEGLVINGAHIGTWANNNRALFRSGNLPENRIDRLKQAGFLFNPFMDFFKERLKELSSFVQVNGRLPRYRDDEKLASWAKKNFKRFLEGKLNPEQYKLLKQQPFNFMFYTGQ